VIVSGRDRESPAWGECWSRGRPIESVAASAASLRPTRSAGLYARERESWVEVSWSRERQLRTENLVAWRVLIACPLQAVRVPLMGRVLGASAGDELRKLVA
jgi:hypothetical protein